jgi:hypothetical protein
LRGAVADETRRKDKAGRPFRQFGYGDQTLLFIDEAHVHLEAIIDILTASALAQGGFEADAVAGHVAKACRLSTAAEATEYLSAVVAAPLAEYTFGEPLAVIHAKGGPHPLGRCLVHESLRHAAPNDPPEVLTEWHEEDFPARVITATVTARDEDSAYIRAVDAIDEAKAILFLSTDHPERRRMLTLRLEDGQIRSTSTGGESFGHYFSPRMLVYPPVTHVSTAAGKARELRTPWEQRVIAATRWYYQAGSTYWPSAALTGAMSTLETLLLTPGLKGKGGRIASTLRDLGAAHLGPEGVKFTTWFANLYDHRNDATHQGVNYDEDLNVQRLLRLTKLALQWGAHHLDPHHRSVGGPCTTLEEALSKHH